MFRLDLKKVTEFARGAETEALLDRVTVFRNQMEPAAVEVMEAELDDRGVTVDAIASHAKYRGETTLIGRDGMAVWCTYCDRPAVERAWAWHRLWGILPVFPRPVARCEEHKPVRRDDRPVD